MSKVCSLLFVFILSVFLQGECFSAGISILCYHKVKDKSPSKYDVTVKQFKEQMKYLMDEKYRFLTIKEIVRHIKEKDPFSEKSIAITVDDGDRSVYEVAYPLFLKYNIPATLCIYTNYVNCGGRSLTWKELLEMRNKGFDIQSHTKSHPYLTRRLKDEAKDKYRERVKEELRMSKKILEEELNKRIEYLAYPYGLSNEYVENEAVKAGYKAMFILNGKKVRISTDIHRLNRFLVLRTTTMDEFKRIIK